MPDIDGITVKVKIENTDLFYELLDILRLATTNKRVPIDIREEITSKIKDILERE